MTLIYELGLDIPKTCSHNENELSRSRLSKLRALQTDTQTGATEKNTTPHSPVLLLRLLFSSFPRVTTVAL